MLALLAHALARQALHSRITFNRTPQPPFCKGGLDGCITAWLEFQRRAEAEHLRFHWVEHNATIGVAVYPLPWGVDAELHVGQGTVLVRVGDVVLL